MRAPAYAAVVLALLAPGCSREPPAPEPSVTVKVAKPALAAGGGPAGVRYTANVTPRAQVDLAFKVNGYIVEIRQLRGADGRMRDLQPGDEVGAGMVLAKVRDTDYVDQVKKAQANLAKARAAQEKAQQDFMRASNLYATDSITAPDYDSAKQEIETAQASVAGAKAQLDEAELNLKYVALTAPMNGVILARKIEVGSLVGPGTTAFSLADTSAVKIVFAVPDVMLGKVALGQTLEVTTESIPGRQFAGKVTQISPSADSRTRAFDVEITVPNADAALKNGMVAALGVQAPAAAAGTALSVPLTAIVRPPGKPDGYGLFVVVEEGGRQVARARTVAVAQVTGNSIVVPSGLHETDRVIVVGTLNLKDGDAVRIAP